MNETPSSLSLDHQLLCIHNLSFLSWRCFPSQLSLHETMDEQFALLKHPTYDQEYFLLLCLAPQITQFVSFCLAGYGATRVDSFDRIGPSPHGRDFLCALWTVHICSYIPCDLHWHRGPYHFCMLLQQSPRETQQWHSISPLCKLFSSERTNANKSKMLHQSMVRTIIKIVNDINSMTSQYVILT